MAGEGSEASMKNVFSVEEKILELVGEFSQGVTDKILLANMPTVDPKARAQAINKLLVEEKIDLFKGNEGLSVSSGHQQIAG